MEETAMSSAFKDATDKLHDRVVALGDEAGRQVREHAPRVRKTLSEGYEETVDTVQELAGNRSVQGLVALGVLGVVVGLLLARR
ncbi:MAG TPA: hypothetical protein VGV37_15155 [Aliidongia sp.]|uniref:hypothetical protein n=1 Tax=Aliidongia sp. TaxID=1914230 RepID=UPI002DDD204E|nr:hypothetical protein [Aliidongia sp.]HEV2675858.1 hypothetical protein [Aliidongia sp.]